MRKEHKSFLTLWNGIAADDGTALLSRLDPRAILPLLPWMTILERDESGSLVFRLAGTGIEGEVGCGMRGRKLAELSNDPRLSGLMEAFVRQAMDSRTGLYINGLFNSPLHKDQPYCGLGLPFLDDKSATRHKHAIFVQVWSPIERCNRDFTNLWGQVELKIDEIFEVHAGDGDAADVMPADIRQMIRVHGIQTGKVPTRRLEGTSA